MKKFKKMLAGLLGAAMVLTSFGTPAWATSTKSPTISTDTRKTGSIIIHKYEYNGNEAKDSTGQKSDEGNLPGDVKPLSGVTFKAYKLADIDQKTATDKSTVLEYKNCIGKLKDSDFDEKTTYESIKSKLPNTMPSESGKAVTDGDGKAVIGGLALGVYLVIELSLIHI